MSIETVRSMLLWSGLINYGLLLFWVVLFLTGRGWLYRLARRLGFGLSDELLDAIQYLTMSLYKLAIFLFFLVPYVVLRFIV